MINLLRLCIPKKTRKKKRKEHLPKTEKFMLTTQEHDWYLDFPPIIL